MFLNENIRISTKNSLKFVPKGLINNIPALVLIMAWRRPGDKLLSELMLLRSLTHICVTRPRWVNSYIVKELWNTIWIYQWHCEILWYLHCFMACLTDAGINKMAGILQTKFSNVILTEKFYILLKFYWSLSLGVWLTIGGIGSGFGLMPSGNKPISEPVLTWILVTIW